MYIDGKQQFYDDVLSGKVEYYSNLILCEENAKKNENVEERVNR